VRSPVSGSGDSSHILRKAPERLADLRTAEGTVLPANIIEELRRDMARLALVREQITSIEKTRAERLERAPYTGPHAMVRLLARVIGIGIETCFPSAFWYVGSARWQCPVCSPLDP
jgi:hypothetical protein